MEQVSETKRLLGRRTSTSQASTFAGEGKISLDNYLRTLDLCSEVIWTILGDFGG